MKAGVLTGHDAINSNESIDENVGERPGFIEWRNLN